MEPSESVLFDDEWEETLDDDVEMCDADSMNEYCTQPVSEAILFAENASSISASRGHGSEEAHNDKAGENVVDNAAAEAKRRTRKKKRRKGGSGSNITDINRFVINTCTQLKEKKSYLIWNAVGCLGISAINDLVKEVAAIQRCGGQKTVDGKRFRTGGGVLWNILKIREPKAYKEIMKKGKEFEKQFKQPQNKQITKKDVVFQRETVHSGAVEDPVTVESTIQQEKVPEFPKPSSVWDRIRVPVTYDDDLLEEGEIHETLVLL